MAIRWIQDGEPHSAEVYNRPLRDYVLETGAGMVSKTTKVNVSNGLSGGGELSGDIDVVGVDATSTRKGVVRFATLAETISGMTQNVAIDPIMFKQAIEVTGQTTASIIISAADVVPNGFLECNGESISRTTYSALFSAIGTTYGEGDGSTTFNIPDLRGEFIRGFDNGRGVDNGRVFGSYQADEFKRHSHGSGSRTRGTPVGSGGYAIIAGSGSQGGDETRPRNIAMMYCIKY